MCRGVPATFARPVAGEGHRTSARRRPVGHHLPVPDENISVDMAVVQVAQADVAFDTWLTEVLNVLAFVEVPATRRSIEASVNRLEAAGIVTAPSGSRPQLTDEGHRVANRLRRHRSTSRARSWLEEDLVRRTGDRAVGQWRLSTGTWKRCAEASRPYQSERLLARMEILQGLLSGIAQLDTINAAVRRCRNRTDAREAVVALGYTAHQAEHILDVPVSRQTREALDGLRLERFQIEALIGRLHGE